MNDRVRVFLGDNREVLRGLADNSVDAVVTDPPYGLSEPPSPAVLRQVLAAWMAGRDYQPAGKGFMGRSWDAFVPGPVVWTECLRVLKPGGHLVAFFGTRTYDLGALSVRLAGFEIRDMLAWLYGSGFPKSYDVAKGIDKAGGASPRGQAALLRARREEAGLSRAYVAAAVGCTESSVRNWEDGRARSAGGPVEWIIPSETYRTALADLLGYSADEREIVGLAIDRRNDGSVVDLGHCGVLRKGGFTDLAAAWEGWGTALKPALEPIVFARKPLDGTVAENVLQHGCGALNIDGCRVSAPEGVPLYAKRQEVSNGIYGDGINGSNRTGEITTGRWPANVIHDGSDEVEAAFPAEAGAFAAVRGSEPSGLVADVYSERARVGAVHHGDSGSAARFFYSAKADGADRLGSDHPTVKRIDLIAWLARLVTPPGGVVLDPFAGSGTTGVAALREGFRAILVERDPRSVADIDLRLEHAAGRAGHSANVKTRNRKPAPAGPLFADDGDAQVGAGGGSVTQTGQYGQFVRDRLPDPS